MRTLVGAVAEAPEQKRLAPAGAYSLRLADIDTRLDQIQQADREISARLQAIEEGTAEANKILHILFASIKRHPLLSKFLKGI